MAYALHDEHALRAVEDLSGESGEFEAVVTRRKTFERDSLSENFNDEIEAWARHAMARNGFGDF